MQATYIEREAWAMQLRAIHHKYPRSVFIGSMGRAAMYTAFGWRPGFELRKPPVSGICAVGSELRDFDILIDEEKIQDDPACNGPHPIDGTIGSLIVCGEALPDRVRLHGVERSPGGSPEPFELQADSALFAPRTRLMDGIPVNTLRIGVHQLVERLIAGPSEHSHYVVERQEFDAFAAAVRPLVPDEFPPPEDLAPLTEFLARKAS